MSKITFGKFELHDTRIRGTKLTVDRLLNLLAKGKTVDDVLKMYPKAKKKDINKALNYAAKAVSDYESVRETEEILSDPNALKEIRDAEKQIARGEYVTLDELKEEIKLRRQHTSRANV